MKKTDPNSILSRLLELHTHSLPMYLSDASPYHTVDDEPRMEILRSIIDSQRAMAERITDALHEGDAAIYQGSYPMAFTGMHDLSLDYLWGRLIEWQERDVAAIEACAEELQPYPLAGSLAEEALGEAKAHLDALRERVSENAAA